MPLVKGPGLTVLEFLLCSYAIELTRNPGVVDKKWFQSLKEARLSDRAVLDVTLVIGYFNLVNRLVLALGVKGNSEEMSGYKY